MNCLYCDSEIKKISFIELIEKRDLLCQECRKKLIKNHSNLKLEDLEVEIFYDYDSLFKTLLIQYKECYDEALKEVFLYNLQDYIKMRYRGYKIIYIPSTEKKMNERGFNHLKGIYECLGLEEINGLRIKDELIQEGKTRKEREKMITNFEYLGEHTNRILLVDDVLTTGSTLIGAYQAIKPYSKGIKAICLAKKNLATEKK